MLLWAGGETVGSRRVPVGGRVNVMAASLHDH